MNDIGPHGMIPSYEEPARLTYEQQEQLFASGHAVALPESILPLTVAQEARFPWVAQYPVIEWGETDKWVWRRMEGDKIFLFEATEKKGDHGLAVYHREQDVDLERSKRRLELFLSGELDVGWCKICGSSNEYGHFTHCKSLQEGTHS